MRERTSWPAVLVAALMGLASAGPIAQAPTQPRLSHTVDVRLVEVDAVITDAEGHPIVDLRKEDFQVFEDGRAQEVATFSFVNLPIAHAEPLVAEAAPYQADVETNVQQADGRAYVLLLDDLHTAALRSPAVRTAARQFVERSLGPADVAAVVYVGAGPRAGQEFTRDRRLLLAAIDRFVGRKAPSETLNKIEDYNRQLMSTGRTPTNVKDMDAPSRGDAARVLLDSLSGIARGLAPLTGRRKALLWFGEGVDYDLLQGPSVTGLARTTFGALARANVAVYGIDARALRGLGDEFMQLSTMPADPTAGLSSATLDKDLLTEQENLRLVSNQTGGAAIVNTTEFAGAYRRVVEETSTYYVLGYYPTNERRDGTFRRIDVKINRPGVVVRARQGYVAPADKADGRTEARSEGVDVGAALQAALANPLPQTSMPIAAQAVAFPTAGARASVLLTVQYGAIGFPPAASSSPGQKLELSVAAVDATGHTAGGDRLTIDLDVKPETKQAIEALGFRTVSRLDLPPGRYQVRVAALQTGTGRLGSVRCDLDVPDFAQSGLGISPLVVTSPMTARTPTAGRDERLSAALPGPPTTVRAFRTDDTLTVYAELTDDASAVDGIQVTTTVLAEDGRVVLTGREERPRQAGSSARPAPFTAQIPLESLSAGVYVLRVEVTSGSGASQARAERQLPIVVLPPE